MSENAEEPKKFDTNRRYCELEEELIDLFIKQISHELTNRHIYLSFANFFANEGLNKLSEYYLKRAEEEDNHHKWIYNWLTYNDVEFQYPNIQTLELNYDDRSFPFQFTVDREIETTDKIDNILERALELKDYRTIAWLNGNGPVEGKLIPEQAEEESISRTIRDIAAEENTSWLIKEESIYNFYFNKN